MIAGILVTHGNLAIELLATARSIFGPFDSCYPVSNEKHSRDSLAEEIEKVLASHPSDDFIIFVDFFGGSTCHAALLAQRDYPNVRLISGVSLPILLAFLYLREHEPFAKLPEELVKRGHHSVKLVDMEDD